jgi:hypothetical protein
MSKIAELAARWYVFVMIWIYGFGKIMGQQFYRQGHLPETIANKTVSALSAFELAWTFFGYSSTYILFIGFSQVLGGILLLWNRSKLLGVAVLLPLLLNIVIVDVVYEVGGATISALFYLVLLLYILYFNRQKVMTALQVLTPKRAAQTDRFKQRGIEGALVLCVLIIVFWVETVLIKLI